MSLDCNTAPMPPTGHPAKAAAAPPDSIDGSTMNKRTQQVLVAVFLSLSIMTSTAQAGLFNWFASNKAQADQASSGSFDQLYASVNTSNMTDAVAMLDTTNALIATSAPSKNATVVTRRTYTVQVSGYNSEVGQTDDSPFITANGTHVRDGIVAANIIDSNGRNIPFNTIVKFKNCGGIAEDKIFIVTDRLNKRYTNNVDIWFTNHSDAIKFGRRTCQIEVMK